MARHLSPGDQVRLVNWVMARDIQPPDGTAEWNQAKPDESLRLLYKFAHDTAADAMAWYWTKKWQGRVGRGLRFLAIAFTTAGGLVPLLLAAEMDNVVGFPLRSEFGYILVAIAGAVIGLDKFFGFSSTWIRYVTTATTIQTQLTKFQFEWAMALAKAGTQPLTGDAYEALIQKLLGLVTSVRAEVETETNAWATQYLSNLASVEKKAEEQLEAQKAGSINVSIANGDQAGDIVVWLDSAPNQTITGSTCAIHPVFPGQHVVALTAEIGGNDVRATSTLINVSPGQTGTVSLTLQ